MMKMSNHFIIKYFFTILFMIILTMSGCRNETLTGPIKITPDIPPVSTFIMDFNDFAMSQTNNNGIKAISPDIVLSIQNWGWAAGNVAVWNTILTVTMAVPVASFVESFKHEPVLQPDGSWVWAYNYHILGVLYSAELHAQNARGGIKWEMYISKDKAYDNFNWYSGYSNVPATEGYWNLNYNPENPTPFLNIEWHRNPVNETADIKYTNIIPDGPENGGYIFYGITTDSPYDAFYDLYNKGKDNHTYIRWIRSTKEGQVYDVLHFNDEKWHCWDSRLEDIECP